MNRENRPSLSVGELFTGTFRELRDVGLPVLAYLAFFVLLGLLVGKTEQLDSLVSLIAFVAYFCGQYYLYRTLLRNASLITDHGPFRVFRLTGMALVLFVPVYIGTAFMIIPGVLLVSRWIMAPAYLVAGGRGTFASIGASWDASDGNTLPIAGAFTLLVICWLFTVGVLANVAAVPGLASDGPESPHVQLSMHTFPLLLMGLSVTAYKALNRDPERLGNVFA